MVNCLAANTLVFWAIALAFALAGVMLHSFAVPVLVGLAVATVHLQIVCRSDARNSRDENQTGTPSSLFPAPSKESLPVRAPSLDLDSARFNAQSQRLLASFVSDAKPFCLVIVEVRNGLAPDDSLDPEAAVAVAESFRRLAGNQDSVLQTGESEFLVLMPNAREIEAELFRWRLVHSIDALASTHADLVAPITSVGVAECSEAESTLNALTKRARGNRYQPSWSSYELRAS